LGQNSCSDRRRLQDLAVTDVTINLLWLRPGRVGGSERYAIQLLKSLCQVQDRPSIELVTSPETYAAHPFLAEHFAINRQKVRWARLGRILHERRLFRANLASPLIHHLGGTIPASNPDIKSVVTIYDVQYRDIPNNFSPAKRIFLNNAIPRALEAAELVCVPSKFCANSLQQHFGFPKERCRLVAPPFDIQAQQTQHPTHSPKEKFLLYPAVTWPHKSHKFLIELAEHVNDVRLIFTGASGPSHAEVLAAMKDSPAADRIDHLGVVGDAQLDSLYRQALCLVFPSRYEGFGQPIVEAMARGCPVIASQYGAIPETVGNGGVTLPLDVDAWSDAVQQMLHPERRTEMIESGFRRARDFSSQRSSTAQLAVYRELLCP
ncbi:MAG: glycosyltransferase family 1 protein, partial [Actinomycetota bacterium]|nr:glycosyltransferase family 1 protein [Actinomycetota bacterium]